MAPLSIIIIGSVMAVCLLAAVYIFKSHFSLSSEQVKRLLIPNLEILKIYGPNMYISVPQGTKYELNILLSKYFSNNNDNSIDEITKYARKNLSVKKGEMNPCYALLIKIINKVISEQSLTPGTFKNQFITKKEFIIMKKKSPMAKTFVTLLETSKKDKEFYVLFFEGKLSKNISEVVSNIINDISRQYDVQGFYLPTVLVVGFQERCRIESFTEREVSLPSGTKYKLCCVVCYNEADKSYLCFNDKDEEKLKELNEKSYVCYELWNLEGPEIIEEAEIMGFVPRVCKMDEIKQTPENKEEVKDEEQKKEMPDDQIAKEDSKNEEEKKSEESKEQPPQENLQE